MLLDTQYFEQRLHEKVLRKGLKLFEAGDIEYTGKQGSEDHFLIGKKIMLSLKKKAGKLMAYTCSCEKDDYCEHLAAALFYFQQEALGISVKKKTAKSKSGKTTKIAPRKKPAATPFEQMEEELKELLEPYLKEKTADQPLLDEIVKEIQHKKASTSAELYYELNLATLVVLPSVFEGRITGDDNALKQWLGQTANELNKKFCGQLSRQEEELWHQATLASVRNNTVLKSDAFLFLVPRLMTFLNDRQKLAKLGEQLESRKYKLSYANRFDKLLIARLEVATKAFRLYREPYFTGYHPSAMEVIIAKAELDFCSGKADAGFNRLALHYDSVKQHHFFYYGAYLDYIIDKAREENKPHIEIAYLKKSLIHNVHILPRHLARLIELVPPEQLDQAINEIISWLKSKPLPYLFDKIADLLFNIGWLDELIDEIRKQHNRFNLLHKVLMEKLPVYDADTLDLYMEHLLEALNEAGFYHFQQRVADKARIYLGQLPEKVSRNFMSQLLDRLGRHKQISRYIEMQR